MRIKIDSADRVFSQYVRLRDMECVRCHSRVDLNEKNLPVSHTASHYYGRGREGTRFSTDNLDTLCFGCHQIWGSTDREAYREFKLKQLGKKRFDLLTIQSRTYHKKDRAMELIKARELLKTVV